MKTKFSVGQFIKSDVLQNQEFWDKATEVLVSQGHPEPQANDAVQVIHDIVRRAVSQFNQLSEFDRAMNNRLKKAEGNEDPKKRFG